MPAGEQAEQRAQHNADHTLELAEQVTGFRAEAGEANAARAAAEQAAAQARADLDTLRADTQTQITDLRDRAQRADDAAASAQAMLQELVGQAPPSTAARPRRWLRPGSRVPPAEPGAGVGGIEPAPAALICTRSSTPTRRPRRRHARPGTHHRRPNGGGYDPERCTWTSAASSRHCAIASSPRGLRTAWSARSWWAPSRRGGCGAWTSGNSSA
ncbi:hypothetical protein AGRA3207_007347 [Actinomadura graeca]|uniref:Uncharacterized protein n=1 Tax=Actinomadura graeca TaxID=2750812 RepID=A0ABX8R7S9_9ACTN|nr:hypothetical protein [Actinomadura graeca]QXJ25797.1 hypothetical protein AGRA3207_007347 [Actinomadura graeca]